MLSEREDSIRKGVEKLKSKLIHGACSSQVAMETRCKEEAYNEVLSLLDAMQEELKFETGDIVKNKKSGDTFVVVTVENDSCILERVKIKALEQDQWEAVEGPVSEDLEKEIQLYIEQKKLLDVGFLVPSVAHHFANWQKQQDYMLIGRHVLIEYDAGVKKGEKIITDKAAKWIRANWRKYAFTDGDGIIHFGLWENDFRNDMED